MMMKVYSALAFILVFVQGYGYESEDFPSLGPMEVNLTMADVVREGDNVTIVCSYNLHGEKLYAAKLFFGEQEFYRYVPKDDTPVHVFFFSNDMKSMVTQTANEKMCQVTLRGMPVSWAGVYQCEVSADQPSFQTTITSRYLTVTGDPVSPPVITVSRYILKEGDTLRARCSSVGGSPPANLTWAINGDKVDSTARSHVVEGEVEESISNLQIMITPELILDSRVLSLRCSATQFTLYNSTSEVKLKVTAAHLGVSSSGKSLITRHGGEVFTVLSLPMLGLIIDCLVFYRWIRVYRFHLGL